MMILLRLLILGGLVFLVWRAWRLWRPVAAPPARERFEKMVRCTVCGQHVPHSQSREIDGDTYCAKHGPDDVDQPAP